MTKKQKIIIGVAAGLAVLCLAACGVTLLIFRAAGSAITNSQIKSPQEAQAAAESIAAFDMPQGYTASQGMKLLGMTVVMYQSSSRVNIMVMEMPTGRELNDADIRQMQRAYDQQSGGRSGMRVVDTKELTIRGKPARIIISEGPLKAGEQFRQVIVYFQGNHGLASMFITGPVSDWNAAAYDAMILSIR